MLRKIEGGITAPKDFKAAGVHAGIKKTGKEDVGVIYSTVPAAAAAKFTTNKMAAAPVLVSREAVSSGKARAIVVNSGCANACTGDQGLIDAKAMAYTAAQALKLDNSEVLVASTGVIGVALPMDKITSGINKAVAALSDTGHETMLASIMTTDTFEKACAYEFTLGGKPCRIAGIAKGAGMIHPNMATMLSFITTDAAIKPEILNKALSQAVELSYNMISVDGDTSTNDMVAVLANGQAGNAPIAAENSQTYQDFYAALKTVCTELAQLIVRDGEGATKFLEINVVGAVDFADAKCTAMAIAKSPLVKTAFFGQDPNWGRILCAVGYSGAQTQPEKTSLAIGDLTIVVDGQAAAGFDTSKLKDIMAAKDIAITVSLGQGEAKATVWTCDFSYEYVKINGEYTT
ncbi:MAG: argJ [Firmicutes bacterium]|nr:argJ [Bacillota bacterium]